MSPFELGFLHKARPPLSVLDNVVNGFFAIDIVLTFFVAYLDKNTYLLIDDRKLIAWKYASTWLAFDVISTIPSELALKISPSPLRTYGLFNMLRLWRLRRVSSLFARYISFLLIFKGVQIFSLLNCDRIYSWTYTDWRKTEISTISGFDVRSLFVYVWMVLLLLSRLPAVEKTQYVY